jgi:hypothetical protein
MAEQYHRPSIAPRPSSIKVTDECPLDILHNRRASDRKEPRHSGVQIYSGARARYTRGSPQIFWKDEGRPALRWNVCSNVGTQGRRLSETSPIPQTEFTIAQRSLPTVEAGKSVPDRQALRPHKAQRRGQIDKEDMRMIRHRGVHHVAPTSGTSTTAVTLTINGATAPTNNVAMGTRHSPT